MILHGQGRQDRVQVVIRWDSEVPKELVLTDNHELTFFNVEAHVPCTGPGD